MDFAVGSETTFTIISIETGDECEIGYTGSTIPWGGGTGSVYHGVMRARPVYSQVDSDGTQMVIKGFENLEKCYGQSAIHLYPEEVGTLQKLVGWPVIMRARKPYGQETLKKLAKHKTGGSQ